MTIIDGRDIELEFGARLLDSYKVSGTPIEATYFQGRNRTMFNLTACTYGLKDVELPFVMYGKDREDISKKKSQLVWLCYGKKELYLPDGFFYTSVLVDAGEISWRGPCIGEFTLVFKGVQHGPYTEVYGPFVYCEGTMPQTDCILCATVTSAAERYPLGDAYFLDVQRGDVLIMDGINKRVLVNGAPAATRCEWTCFPFLTPGENEVVCGDCVQIGYYPCYI